MSECGQLQTLIHANLRRASEAAAYALRAADRCDAHFAAVALTYAEAWYSQCRSEHTAWRTTQPLSRPRLLSGCEKNASIDCVVCRIRAAENIVCSGNRSADVSGRLRALHSAKTLLGRNRSWNSTLILQLAPRRPTPSWTPNERVATCFLPQFVAVAPLLDAAAAGCSYTAMPAYINRRALFPHSSPGWNLSLSDFHAQYATRSAVAFAANNLLHPKYKKVAKDAIPLVDRYRACRVCHLLLFMGFEDAASLVRIRVGDSFDVCATGFREVSRQMLHLASESTKGDLTGELSPCILLGQCPSGHRRVAHGSGASGKARQQAGLLAKPSNASWMNRTVQTVCSPLTVAEVQDAGRHFRMFLETPGDNPYSWPAIMAGLADGAIIVQTGVTAGYVQPGLDRISQGLFRVDTECELAAVARASNHSSFAELGFAQKKFYHACLAPGRNAPNRIAASAIEAHAHSQGSSCGFPAARVFDEAFKHTPSDFWEYTGSSGSVHGR